MDVKPAINKPETHAKPRLKAQLRPAKITTRPIQAKTPRPRQSVSTRELRSLDKSKRDTNDQQLPGAGLGAENDAIPSPLKSADSGGHQTRMQQELTDAKPSTAKRKRTASIPAITSEAGRKGQHVKKQHVSFARPIKSEQPLPAAASTPTKSSLAKVRSKHETSTSSKPAKIKAEASAELERECAICADSKPVYHNFPSFKPCTHLPQTCVACITKQTFTKLESFGTWESCTCAQCGLAMPEAQLAAALSAKDRTRAKALVLRHNLESDEAWRWCVAPNCDGGQLHVPKTRSQKRTLIVICNKCSGQSCFHHRIPWHPGYTCEQYDDTHPAAQSVRSTEERIRRISKACPGVGCGRRVVCNLGGLHA